MEVAWQVQSQVCDAKAGISLIYVQWSPVIRTSDTISGFLGSVGLNAELHPDSWTVSGSEGFRRFFYLFAMDQAEINNWKTIAERMEAKGDTESWFYLRARAIADGKPDPMPSVSELMGGSAA